MYQEERFVKKKENRQFSIKMSAMKVHNDTIVHHYKIQVASDSGSGRDF